jgi:hypothetical protein
MIPLTGYRRGHVLSLSLCSEDHVVFTMRRECFSLRDMFFNTP